MFCVALGEYSAINVFKFLLINLLSKLLEDPSSYRIDRDASIPTEQLSILTTMSDMVLTLANSDSDESATEAQAQAYELFNVFQAWIENPCVCFVSILISLISCLSFILSLFSILLSLICCLSFIVCFSRF